MPTDQENQDLLKLVSSEHLKEFVTLEANTFKHIKEFATFDIKNFKNLKEFATLEANTFKHHFVTKTSNI